MMKREIGDKSFPIWLLGDSEPHNWKAVLDTPFDPRHPIRHNIWTSILEPIQKKLFQNSRTRLNSDKIFIRNAVDSPTIKPKRNEIDWSSNTHLNSEIHTYSTLIKKFRPRLILSFGSFSFEFGRRSLGETPNRAYNYWGSEKLGKEFRNRIHNSQNTTLIPLMHRVIAGGRFPNAHRYFMGKDKSAPIPNYFDYVAEELSNIIINYPDTLLIK